jgi:hypothetical protein
MQVGQFPASAANSLIDGYCEDYQSLAALLTQTLEQVSERGIDIRGSALRLIEIEQEMRKLADKIGEIVNNGHLTKECSQSSDTRFIGVPILSNEELVHDANHHGDDLQVHDGIPTGGDESDSNQPSKSHTQNLEPTESASTPATGKATSSEQKGAKDTQTNQQRNANRIARGFRAKSCQQTNTAPIAKTGEANQTHAINQAELDEEDNQPGLNGTNESMPVSSVFQFLERMRKSGVMVLTLADETLTFEFSKGYVQACTTDNPNMNDRLGDLLKSVCPPDRIEDLNKNCADQKKAKLGEKIVGAGLASNGEVLEALESQVKRRFERACNATEASYQFLDGHVGETDGRIWLSPIELSFKSRWTSAS